MSFEQFGILTGIQYPVSFGESMLQLANGETHPDVSLHSFQYHFMKQSIDRTKPASILVTSDNSVEKCVIEFKNSSGQTAGIFKGNLVKHQPKECVLIFDGTQFRIEHTVSGAIGLKDSLGHFDRHGTRHAKVPDSNEAVLSNSLPLQKTSPTHASSPNLSDSGEAKQADASKKMKFVLPTSEPSQSEPSSPLSGTSSDAAANQKPIKITFSKRPRNGQPYPCKASPVNAVSPSMLSPVEESEVPSSATRNPSDTAEHPAQNQDYFNSSTRPNEGICLENLDIARQIDSSDEDSDDNSFDSSDSSSD
ncbi:uncharacterized protein LOC126322534 [Schistocerca gregaria]|uniref:uncharacterized protein LOC126322534 n=1 Tax=Schistocerca gregaria TaxID=7010 RepID=UPI00211EF033|nr:uncharacterized protein LOC126322534 [Schistocerca gregaria]